MINVGDSAPTFELPGTNGGDIEMFQLEAATDTGAAVLLFYPFDFSPVCTEELCEFRDSEWLTFNEGLAVFGISTDSAFAHREVSNEHDLPYPLLSDHDGSVSRAYDALYDELEGHKQVCKRAVVVVDDDRTVRYAWEAEEWLTDPDITAVHEAVQQLDGVSV